MTVKTVQTKKERSDALVDKIMERDEAMTARLEALAAQLHQLATDIERTEAHLEHLRQTMDADPGVALIEVAGTIAPGTTVSTPNASLTLSEPRQNIRITETDDPDETGSRRWRLEFTPRD